MSTTVQIDATRDHNWRESTLWKILEFISKVSSVGTVLFVAGRLSNIPTYIVDWTVAGIVVTLTIALIKWRILGEVLKIGLPIICVVLAFLLLWILLRKDNWIDWNRRVSQSVANCKAIDGAQDPCLAAALTEQELPMKSSGLLVEHLASDLRAGTFFLQHDAISKMLERRLGIRKNFLGTGFALPTSVPGYEAARLPEYLVPNYEVRKNSSALDAQLDPKANFHYMTIEEIVKRELKLTDRKELRDFLQKLEKAFDDATVPPPVVRFQQFPRGDYKGLFGRADAKRVFFVNLKAVWKMKLIDAANLSGFEISPTSKNSDDIIFVWVFLPTTHNEVVPATWEKMVPLLKGWVSDK